MRFHVQDMSCNHCVASITKAISGLSADAQVICDLPNRIVEVSDNIDRSPDSIIAALSDLGFEAKLIEGQA